MGSVFAVLPTRKAKPIPLPAVAAVALMVSLPFLNPVHLVPITTFFEEWLAFALGLAALACVAVRRFPGPLEVPAISLWTTALAFVLLLQPYWRPVDYSQPATLAGLYVLWAAAMMWVGAQLRIADDRSIADILAVAVLLGAMASAGSGWIQVLGLNAHYGNWVPLTTYRAAGLLSQPNLQANYLVLGSASLIFLWREGRIRSSVSFICGMLLATGIALAASRAALLELAVLLVVSVWFGERASGDRQGRRFWVGVVVFCLLLAASIVAVDLMFHSLAVSARAANPEEANEPMRRLALYEAAIRAWWSAPLAGVGVGGFSWAHYTIPRPWTGSVAMPVSHNAHDIVLQLLAETGLVGAGVFLAAVVLWLLAAARRTETGSTAWRPWALGMVSIELAHSLVEYPLWNANFLGVAALLMGFSDPRLHRMKSQVTSRGLALGAAGIGAVILFATLRAELELLYWGTMPPELRSDPALRQMQQQAMSRVKRSLLAPYGDVTNALALPVSRDHLDARIAFLERVMHFWPDAAIVQKQILLLAMAGKNDRALALLADLARLQPRYLARLNGELQRISPEDIPADSPLRQRLRERASRQEP